MQPDWELHTIDRRDLRIGTRLKAARQRLGWSREALAFHSGMSWSAIAQIESGRRKQARPDSLSALASALGVTVDYLIHGGPHPTTMLSHQVLVYGTDEQFVAAAEPFLAEGLERSEAVLVVTTKTNIRLLRKSLGSGGRRIEFVEAQTWYTTPVSTLNAYRAFVTKGIPDAPWVRILGEPVWTGRSNPEIRIWTLYESLLNLVFESSPATVLCPYDERSVDPLIAREALLVHPQLMRQGRTVPNPDYQDPDGFLLGTAPDAQ